MATNGPVRIPTGKAPVPTRTAAPTRSMPVVYVQRSQEFARIMQGARR